MCHFSLYEYTKALEVIDFNVIGTYRLDELDSTLSMPSSTGGMKRCGFNLEKLNLPGRAKKKTSQSFRYSVKIGSDGLKTFVR